MAAPTNTFCVFAPNDMKITKIKLKKGQQISKGTLACLYTSGTDVAQKFKSNDGGIVSQILVKEGEDVDKGCVLFKLQGCSHPTVMKDMCADCGADLRIENSTAGNRKEEVSASVAMVHSIPELIVSEELAKELGKADEERLLKTRKLVLLVDLDQTLIHTTNDNIPANLKDVHHYQLWHGNHLLWYHTRLRPQTQSFLENISKLYELHICTFGSRIYAHTIAKILDPEGKFFSHRILSRDECFNSQAKTANLKALFPCGDAMVCIIDDREDVWHYSPNLVHVKPYRFFQGTADINAPPGLTKTEHDSETIVHRVRKISQSSTGSNDDKSDSSKGETDKKIESEKAETTDNDKDKEDETNKMETDDIQDNVVVKEGSTKDGTSKEEKKTENVNGKENLENKEGDDDTNKENNECQQDGNKMETSEDEVNIKADESSKKDESKTSDGVDDVKQVEKGENENKDENSEEQDLIEWDDEDDYLLYLEEILKTVHSAFYDFYDQLKGKEMEEKLDQEISEKPSLKNLIPYIKKKVLKGCKILFSGVIPTNMIPEKSRAYTVAKALGANIHTEFKTKDNEKDPNEFTTHLVAARPGTCKVRTAMKYKHVKKVNPDWLWSCSERWERVEESLFPIPPGSDTDDKGRDSPDISQLQKMVSKRKRQQETEKESNPSDSKRMRKVNSSNELEDKSSETEGNENNDDEIDENQKNDSPEMKENFSMSYNPIYAFSDDDLAYMDKEVDNEMDEGDDSSEDEEGRDERIRKQVLKPVGHPDDSSSEDSLSGNTPRGWGLKKKMSPKSSSEDEMKGSNSPDHELGPEYESETDQDKFDKIMDAFGPETENSDDEYAESVGSVDQEIADAVMKEFLS